MFSSPPYKMIFLNRRFFFLDDLTGFEITYLLEVRIKLIFYSNLSLLIADYGVNSASRAVQFHFHMVCCSASHILVSDSYNPCNRQRFFNPKGKSLKSSFVKLTDIFRFN